MRGLDPHSVCCMRIAITSWLGWKQAGFDSRRKSGLFLIAVVQQVSFWRTERRLAVGLTRSLTSRRRYLRVSKADCKSALRQNETCWQSFAGD
jgi:hypothetical protein